MQLKTLRSGVNKVADSREKIIRDTQKLKQQSIDAGYHGEEFERWESREPKVPRRLALGCYEELQPLYEFLVTYAKKSAEAGKVLEFDITKLDVYDKYIKVMHYYKFMEANFISFCIDVACQIVKRMLKGEMTYHEGMELLYNYLKRWEFPSHIQSREISRPYQGEHFEALVDRYHERILAHVEEGKRIAADNLKKRGELNE